MKIVAKILILLLTLNLLSCKDSAKETIALCSLEMEMDIFPKPIGIINDYGQIFTKSQRTELTNILYDYDVKTKRQILVVTVDSIKPYVEIQKYATDLGNDWRVGAAKKNNGLAIVVCKPCRQIGIATGLGTELILTDEICKEVIEKTIIPEFKSGEFYNGIKNGVTELIAKWK
ncbi:TPM domain-containing protein [Aquimarina sp. W85]|uniref:TPM domain-containing protein n=1 Tax=Aquimarina rhodophyticola TaxID=3342246 RepID=UPI00366ECB08